jgi:hypothetical protein
MPREDGPNYIQEEENTWDHFIALARYGQFLGNNEVYREAIALLDGKASDKRIGPQSHGA